MGIQKFRADQPDYPCANGSVAWRTNWIGGPSLALIRDCPIKTKQDQPAISRRTVYVTDQPDSWFSVPAACRYKGKTVRGYLSYELTEGWIFNVVEMP